MGSDVHKRIDLRAKPEVEGHVAMPRHAAQIVVVVHPGPGRATLGLQGDDRVTEVERGEVEGAV